jgi:hypothetical protein
MGGISAPYGRIWLIVFRLAGLDAATASSRVATLPVTVRRRALGKIARLGAVGEDTEVDRRAVGQHLPPITSKTSAEAGAYVFACDCLARPGAAPEARRRARLAGSGLSQ